MRKRTFGLLGGGLLCAVLTALVALCCLPVTAHADESNKTLTVDQTATVEEGVTYQDIQSAINYVNTQDDKTGWTITVEPGTYRRFTVLDGLDGLTVRANERGTVTVETVNNSEPPAPVSGGCPDTAGISVRYAQNVTLENLDVTAGSQSSPWYLAAISNYSESTDRGSGLSIVNCSITGSGSGYGVFINAGTTSFNVINSSISSLSEGISLYGDGTTLTEANVTGNTFTNCSFAMHGYYYGGTGTAGILTFANNTVTGSDTLRCKVVVQDGDGAGINDGALRVDIRNNTLTNALIGLVNLSEDGETISDPLTSNSFGESCFYVTANEPGSIEAYTTYLAPEDSAGRWAIQENAGATWTSEQRKAIEDAIADANAGDTKKLSITGLPDGTLIPTFTHFKDGIYWESYPAGTLTISKQSTGDLANPADEFAFTVTLKGDDIPEGKQVFGGQTFTDGVAEITLKAGESATIKGIPAGTAYTVEETDAKGYVSTSTGAEGTIAADATATAAFTNDKSTPTYTTGGFVATKTLAGADIADYTFTFQVTDADGNVVDTATNDAEGKVAFKKNMTLPEGEHVYYVSEVNDGQDNIVYDDAQYKVTVKVTKGEDGKLGALWYIEDEDGNSVSEITFANSYDDGTVPPTDATKPPANTTDSKPADTKTEAPAKKAELPGTGDPTSLVAVGAALVAGVGAGAAGIIVRRRNR